MKTKMLITLAVLFAGTVAFAGPTVAEILNEFTITELTGSNYYSWYDENGGLTFRGKYAGYDHEVGVVYYMDQDPGDWTTVWFDGANNDGVFDGDDIDSFDFLNNDRAFMFALKVANTNNVWYSDPALNDGNVHVKFYRLEGEFDDGHQIYAMAWEDKGPAEASDWDYNDNVVLFSGASPVPAPSAILLAGLGLTIVSRFRRRQ